MYDNKILNWIVNNLLSINIHISICDINCVLVVWWSQVVLVEVLIFIATFHNFHLYHDYQGILGYESMDSYTQLPLIFPAMGRCLKNLNTWGGYRDIGGQTPVCGERCVVRCQPDLLTIQLLRWWTFEKGHFTIFDKELEYPRKTNQNKNKTRQK